MIKLFLPLVFVAACTGQPGSGPGDECPPPPPDPVPCIRLGTALANNAYLVHARAEEGADATELLDLLDYHLERAGPFVDCAEELLDEYYDRVRGDG